MRRLMTILMMLPAATALAACTLVADRDDFTFGDGDGDGDSDGDGDADGDADGDGDLTISMAIVDCDNLDAPDCDCDTTPTGVVYCTVDIGVDYRQPVPILNRFVVTFGADFHGGAFGSAEAMFDTGGIPLAETDGEHDWNAVLDHDTTLGNPGTGEPLEPGSVHTISLRVVDTESNERTLEQRVVIGNLDPECDLDADGFVAASCGGDDCDDTLVEVNPGALEICDNGRDDDCDGLTDPGVFSAGLDLRLGSGNGARHLDVASSDEGLFVAWANNADGTVELFQVGSDLTVVHWASIVAPAPEYASVEVAGDTVGLAWQETPDRGSPQVRFTSFIGPDDWTEPATISIGVGGMRAPSLATNSEIFLVAYQNAMDGSLEAARFAPDGNELPQTRRSITSPAGATVHTQPAATWVNGFGVWAVAYRATLAGISAIRLAYVEDDLSPQADDMISGADATVASPTLATNGAFLVVNWVDDRQNAVHGRGLDVGDGFLDGPLLILDPSVAAADARPSVTWNESYETFTTLWNDVPDGGFGMGGVRRVGDRFEIAFSETLPNRGHPLAEVEVTAAGPDGFAYAFIARDGDLGTVFVDLLGGCF